MRPQESSLFLQGDQLSVAEVLFVSPRVRPRTFFLISPSFFPSSSLLYAAMLRFSWVVLVCENSTLDLVNLRWLEIPHRLTMPNRVPSQPACEGERERVRRRSGRCGLRAQLARCKITVGKANERYENKILDRNEGIFCAALKPACRVEIEHSIYLDCLELLARELD